MTIVYRNFFVLCGVLACIAGIIGIIVPVLPTTPFLLLASWFFAKSSPQLHAKMRSNKYIGTILTSWEDTRSIPMKAKVLAVTMIVLSCGFSIVYITFFVVRLVLVICGIGVSVYILTRKTAE
jgi:uncharacterized membrane protein YbaN (DUF454 family)